MPTPDMSDPGAANQDWLNQFLTWLGNSGQGQAPAAPGGAQNPYQTAGLGWTGPPTYDQAARLRAHLVSPAGVIPITDQGGNSISPNSAPPPAPAAPAAPTVASAPPQPTYNPLAGGSANTGRPYGIGPPPQPPYNVLGGGSANTGLPPGGGSTAPAAAPATRPPVAPVPNLGYYAPTTGIAGRGTWIGPGDPRYVSPAKDPRVYRGPLSMYGRG